MSLVQRLVLLVVPRAWGQALEAQSRAWMLRCQSCRHERSIWDTGGLRWAAKGSPHRRLRCPKCHRETWHQVHLPTASASVACK